MPPYAILIAMYEILDWDTRLFGFKVARIVGARLSEAQLAKTLGDLKAAGVVLAYWSAADETQLAALGARHGGLLADRKVTYAANFLEPRPAEPSYPAGIERYQGPSIAELESLAIQSGEHSRFAVDPKFPRGAFERLYRQWMRASLDGSYAEAVLVYRDPEAGDIRGMITLSRNERGGSIGLVAVDRESRGGRIGQQLVEATREYLVAGGTSHVEVVTQERNDAAAALYARCGYSVAHVQNVFHFWPTGGPPDEQK